MFGGLNIGGIGTLKSDDAAEKEQLQCFPRDDWVSRRDAYLNATASNNKIKIRAISKRKKLEILQKLDNKVPIGTIASDYHIHPSTVRRIRLNASTISPDADQGHRVPTRNRLQRSTYTELESRLYAWFVERRKLGDPISDSILRQKAVQLIKEIAAQSTFRATVSWLRKFKRRYDIRLVNRFREKGSADAAAAERFSSDFARRVEAAGIEHSNIYNMDVSGLLWKALPTSTLERDASDEKGKEDLVTVGFCANMAGTHKLLPLFVHKFKYPKAMKKIKTSLPVVYKVQKNAWMDQLVFTDWYQNNFKPAVRGYQQCSGTSGKVILLLDNCIAHKLRSVEFQKDQQFEIVFLPPNTSSIIQPMDQGVILKAKRAFHCRMLRRVLTYFGSVEEFYEKYNFKDCIDLLDDAWKEVSVWNIWNSWNNMMKNGREGMPEGEEPTDPLEPQLEEVIAAITGEEPSPERVKEFLTNCHDAETNFSEAEALNEGVEEEEEEEEEEEASEAVEDEETEATGDGDAVETYEEKVRVEDAMETHEEKVRVGEVAVEWQEEKARVEEDAAETHEEKFRVEDTVQQEIRRAVEFLMQHAEQSPQYVKRSLANVRDYFLGEGT